MGVSRFVGNSACELCPQVSYVGLPSAVLVAPPALRFRRRALSRMSRPEVFRFV